MQCLPVAHPATVDGHAVDYMYVRQPQTVERIGETVRLSRA